MKGEYTIGELIVPQSFQKVQIVDNEVIIKEVKVQGRKIPFQIIREKVNDKQKIFFVYIMMKNSLT